MLPTETLPTETEVLIVGAGPIGLALAITLQQVGIRHLLIDRLESGQNTSRAAVIHAHTLEALEPLGVTQALLERGLAVSRFTIRDRDRALVRLGFEALPSRHRGLLMLPQDVTEAVLADRLAALGGAVHRGVTATAITTHGDGASVTLATPAGQQAVRARYVVGADGMHSLVRQASGIAFDGGSYAESFVLADVRMRWSLGTSEVSLFFSPDGMVVVAPLPNGGFRVVATMEDAPEQPSQQDIQRLIDARGPRSGVNRVEQVVWSSRFRLHHRVAGAYRNGPLLLMGDAAHVHSPAGGQGMNTGLVDAVVLGDMLARVLRGGAPDALLDGYGALRRPAAIAVLGLAGRLTTLATARSTARRLLRNAVLRVINALPWAKRRLVMNLSGISRRALAQVA